MYRSAFGQRGKYVLFSTEFKVQVQLLQIKRNGLSELELKTSG